MNTPTPISETSKAEVQASKLHSLVDSAHERIEQETAHTEAWKLFDSLNETQEPASEEGILLATALLHSPHARLAYTSEAKRTLGTHRTSDLYMGVASLMMTGKLAEPILRNLEKYKKCYPKKYETLLGDLGYLAKAKHLSTELDPSLKNTHINSKIEDPFKLGKSWIKKVQQITFDKDSALFLQDFYKSDIQSIIPKYIGKLPKRMSAMLQTYVIVYFTDLLGAVDAGEDALRAWNYYSIKLSETHIASRILFFMHLRKNIPENEARSIVGRLLKEFFESPDNNIDTLIILYNSPAGAYFTPTLEKNETVREKFLQLSKKGTSLERAFAFKVLGEYCNAQDTHNRLKTLLKGFNSAQALKRATTLARLAALFTAISPIEDHLPMIVDTLLEDDQVLLAAPISLYRERSLSEIAQYLRKTFEVFTLFSDELLHSALDRRLEDQPASSALYRELQKIQLPEDFDPFLAKLEIEDNTSLPLVEKRTMPTQGILSNVWSICIYPNENTDDRFASWSLELRMTTAKKKKYIQEVLKLNFEESHLTSYVDPQIRPLVEKVGLYFAHKYFVRQKPTSGTADEDDGPDIEFEEISEEELDIPDSKPENDLPDSEPPPSEDEREFNERSEAPLTINIAQKAEKDISDRKDLIRQTLEKNKALVSKLVTGDISEEELEQVIVHQVVPGERPGQKLYERVIVQNIQEALQEGTLLEQPWYILNTLPHIKMLGFHVWGHKIEDEKGEQQAEPLWLVKTKERSSNAEDAYLSYLCSGFPELSEFSELKASLGIVANAERKKGELISIQTEDGEELLMGTTIKRDINARLAQRTTSKRWMKQWLATQRRIFNEEIEEILSSNLSDDEKMREALAREEEIEELPELIVQTMKQSGIRNVDRTRSLTGQSVRLALGWVKTQTSFNQGQFVPLSKFAVAKEDVA